MWGRHPINAGAVDGFLPRLEPGFSSSMPSPNRPPQQSAQGVVKSAPKREGPGGGCAPGPSSPDPFLGGFELRAAITMTPKPQGGSKEAS